MSLLALGIASDAVAIGIADRTAADGELVLSFGAGQIGTGLGAIAGVGAGGGRRRSRGGRLRRWLRRANAGRPQAEVGLPGGFLSGQKAVLILDVWREGGDCGEALGHQCFVDQFIAFPDITQEAVVTVGFGDVLFQADVLALKKFIGFLGGLLPEAAAPAADFRGVDADQPNDFAS